MRILKGIVAGIIAALILYAIYAIVYSVPYDIIPPIIIGFGVFLFILSVFSNIKRSSPLKLGAVSQTQFWSVMAVMVGVLLAMNGRIDDIYQILITMQ